jgi:hypothetical protein
MDLKDKAWLAEKYTKDKLSVRAIGKIVGKSGQSVLNALELYGIPTRYKNRDPRLADRQKLADLYISQGMSASAVGKALGGFDSSAVLKALHRHKIPVRSRGAGRAKEVAS